MAERPYVLVFSIGCFLWLSSSWLSAAPIHGQQSSLRFVHVIWRHGDRAPAWQTFPTDHNKVWTWPEGWGELTKRGMRQQYQLGQYLRKRYIDTGFLSPDYNYTEIYVQSTNFNRTIMSALSNLAGFYPPQESTNWKEGMTWQPIPVHSIPKMDDPVVWPERPCPKADNIQNEVINSEEVKQYLEENKNFLMFLRNKTGLGSKLGNLYDIKYVYDPLYCELENNHTWPTWVTKRDFDQITDMFHHSTRYYFHDPRLQRLKGGLLLGQIATRFDQKAKNSPLLQPPQLRYYVYSAHDTTMVAQLENLGAYDGQMPPYASALLYELHEKTPGKFTIEVHYIKGQRTPEPVQLTIRGCEGACDLDTFVNLANNRTPSDWYTDCGLSNKDPNP